MTHGELTIRPYRKGDEERILETFNLVFREVCGDGYVDRTMEQWRWQYLENPMGHRMSLAVAPDGTVVSQYAGVPLLADTPRGSGTFVHCVDSMTHPAWRKGLKRPGIFVITGLPFSAHSRRIGDALLFGFPVDAAFRIGKRYLEYHFLRVIDYLIRDAAEEIPPLPSGLRVGRTQGIPPDVGGLYERMRAAKRCLLRRDYRYLDWRYAANPSRADYDLWEVRGGGSLRAFLVLRPRHELVPDSCTIVDWIAEEGDEDAATALVHVAAARAREEGRKRVLAVFAEPSPEYAWLLEHGFAAVPSANWLERRLVYLITGSLLTEQDLREDWWYTLGDSDLA
ncbi:MAG: hypothetical protein Fur0037_09220 [Planctomycetota bacterium]